MLHFVLRSFFQATLPCRSLLFKVLCIFILWTARLAFATLFCSSFAVQFCRFFLEWPETWWEMLSKIFLGLSDLALTNSFSQHLLVQCAMYSFKTFLWQTCLPPGLNESRRENFVVILLWGRGPNRGWMGDPSGYIEGTRPLIKSPNTPFQECCTNTTALGKCTAPAGRPPSTCWVETAPSPRSDASVCRLKGREKLGVNSSGTSQRATFIL